MSFTPAKPITSPQQGVHDNLEKVVRKHLATKSQKPIAEHNQTAFDEAYHYWQQRGKPPVLLDSCCGTGESSRYLAATHPNHLVIGLDQSCKRLQNSANTHLPENCLLLQCECSDFWQLAEQKQWCFEKHTIFYPNPYPKTQHLQRRWHGHSALSSLLRISQYIELRTNWKIYAEEFQQTLAIAKSMGFAINNIERQQYFTDEPITAFERKYQLSSHQLWQVTASLSPNLSIA